MTLSNRLGTFEASPGGEAGSPQGLTDEVEAINFYHGSVRRCDLRPHPVRLEPDHHSRGMTATGSHIDFGFAARSTTLQGKAFLKRSAAFASIFATQIPSPGGWGMPTPLQRPAVRFSHPPLFTLLFSLFTFLSIKQNSAPGGIDRRGRDAKVTCLLLVLGVGDDLGLVGLGHFLIALEVHGEGTSGLGHGP